MRSVVRAAKRFWHRTLTELARSGPPRGAARRIFEICPELWVVLAFAVPLFPLRSWLADNVPLLAVAGGFAFYLLPGAFLSVLLPLEGNLLERLAHALALSATVLAPPAIAASALHLSLREYASFCMIITGVLALAAVWRLRGIALGKWLPSEDRAPGLQSPFLMFCLTLGTAAIFVMSIGVGLQVDDWRGVAIVRQDQVAEQLHVGQALLGSSVPPPTRLVWNAWVFVADLVAYLSQVAPPTMLPILDGLVVLLSVGALYGLARALFVRRDQAAFITILWLLYHIATFMNMRPGWDLILRMAQDKFTVRFVLVPVALQLTIEFFKGRKRRDLVRLILVALGSAAIHPLGSILIGLSLGGFGVIHLLFNRDRQTFFFLALIAFVLLVGLAFPILQSRGLSRENVAHTLIDDPRDPSLWGRMGLATSGRRLWILNEKLYILHPYMVLQPEIILAYLCLPLLVWLWRRSMAARLLSGVLLFMPLFLFVPQVAGLVGYKMTPWIFYRLAWPYYLAAPLIVGWGIWIVVNQLRARVRWLSRLSPQVALLVIIFLSIPILRDRLYWWQEVSTLSTEPECEWSKSVLAQLDEVMNEETIVLAGRELATCVPAFTAHGKVVESHLTGTVNWLTPEREEEAWQRLYDVLSYEAAYVVDGEIFDIINRWNVKYVVILKERPLAAQFRHLPRLFELIAQNERYAVYRVKQVNKDDPVVAASTALANRDWNLALARYQALQQGDAQDRFLAFMGLGRLYQLQGNLDQAIRAYEQATQIDSRDPEPYIQLGNAYTLALQFDKAIPVYEQALRLHPLHVYATNALGNAHWALGDKAEARQFYEEAQAALMPPQAVHAYNLQIGRLFTSLGWYQEALEVYQQALTIAEDASTYLSIASTYERMQEWDKAKAALDKALQIDPWNSGVYRALGDFYEQRGQRDAAMSHYQRSIGLNPNESAYSSLGRLWQGNWGASEAARNLKEMTGYRLNISRATSAVATVLSLSGKFSQAALEYQKAIDWEAVESAWYLALGQVQGRLGLRDKAIDSCQRSILWNNRNVNAWLALGDVYLREARVNEAIGTYWEAAAVSPQSPQPYLSLGHLYQTQGLFDLAFTQYERALQMQPDSSAIAIALGSFYRNRGEPDLAIAMYEKAIARAPFDSGGYLSLGSLYLSQGRLTEALAQYKKAVEVDPGSAKAHISLGSTYQRLGQNDQAIAEYQRALLSEPGNVDAYCALAGIYSTLGRDHDAIGVYLDMLDTLPDQADPYVKLGQLYERVGRGDEAKALYEVAISRYSPLLTISAHDALAHWYRNRAKWDSAEEQYGRAIALDPVSPRHHVALGKLYQQVGDDSGAERMFRQAIATGPSDASGYLALAQLYQTRGRFDDALAQFQEAVRMAPASAEPYVRLGGWHMARGNPDAASEAYQRAIAAAPGDKRAPTWPWAAYRPSRGIGTALLNPTFKRLR